LRSRKADHDLLHGGVCLSDRGQGRDEQATNKQDGNEEWRALKAAAMRQHLGTPCDNDLDRSTWILADQHAGIELDKVAMLR
jgi:hypothetical protein